MATLTDDELLLDAIRASSDDDTPRLVYADWLTENGDCERGEFIREQIELYGLLNTQSERTSPCPENARIYDLNRRCRTRIRNRWDSWFPAAVPDREYSFKAKGHCGLEVLDGDGVFMGFEFVRGFVEKVWAGVRRYEEVVAKVFEQPITEVNLGIIQAARNDNDLGEWGYAGEYFYRRWGNRFPNGSLESHDLSTAVFELLPDARIPAQYHHLAFYPSARAAKRGLNLALIAYGQREFQRARRLTT